MCHFGSSVASQVSARSVSPVVVFRKSQPVPNELQDEAEDRRVETEGLQLSYTPESHVALDYGYGEYKEVPKILAESRPGRASRRQRNGCEREEKGEGKAKREKKRTKSPNAPHCSHLSQNWPSKSIGQRELFTHQDTRTPTTTRL